MKAPNHTSRSNLDLTRRQWLGRQGLGGLALWSLLDAEKTRASAPPPMAALARLHHRPTAKRVIYIFQAGGPAQMELFDHKPKLKEMHGKELPESTRKQQRLTGFTQGQGKYPLVASSFKFKQRGQCGHWMSELLPNMAGVADELCLIKSMHTEAVNHDPAVTHMLTGAQQPGRPSIGAWLSYGLGSEASDLPAFVVLLTPGLIQDASTPLSARHWGSGFLPAKHQGVQFRRGKDPVLFLSNPIGINQAARRASLDALAALNRADRAQSNDPRIDARIAQYELAYRMQTSVPQLMNFSNEADHTFKLYGPQAKVPGSYAANCLLARRLVESGVRFVQIFDRDWDHHRNAPQHLKTKTQMTEQPTAALIRDLKQRGLLDDTLVVCCGEFGRTAYCQGKLQEKYGRDHHGGCFTAWMAGGGVKAGHQHGETDEFSFNIASDPVHVFDLQATILHCLGIDHRRLTFKHQSREFRLTDVGGHVLHSILKS